MVENEDNLALTPVGDFAQFFSSYVFCAFPLYNTSCFGVSVQPNPGIGVEKQMTLGMTSDIRYQLGPLPIVTS